MISKFFIERPVLSNVIAMLMILIGGVALPIEQQVNGVEDMLYMQSYSGADGSYTLTVTFKIGTDLNFAQVLVQNRVSSALSALPQAVQVQGVNVQKKSTAILQIVTLTSPSPCNSKANRSRPGRSACRRRRAVRPSSIPST